MAGEGKKFEFHGAFNEKKNAVRKEKEVGGFIRKVKVNGEKRFAVLTRKS